MKEFKICFTDEKYAVYFYNLIYNTGTTAILNRDSILIVEAENVSSNQNVVYVLKLKDESFAILNNSLIAFMVVKDLES